VAPLSSSYLGLEGRLEGLLDQLAARKDVRTAVLGVASGKGQFRWIGARGETVPGGPAMTPETPWFIASITKLFIAATVLRLVEDGALALEDRLVDLLPSSVTGGLHVQDGVDRTDQITVEHLLAHASGLPDYIEDFPPRSRKGVRLSGVRPSGTGGDGGGPDAAPPGRPDRRSLVEILLAEGDRDWTLDDTVRRVRERLRPHFPPQDLSGRKVTVRYSDTNFHLLMALVAAQTGQPFHQVLEERILVPLKLDATWVPGHPRPGIPESPVAALWAGDERVEFPRFFQSIADLNATAGDLLRFLMALEQEGLFQDPGTWRRMQARWNRFSQPTDRAALRQPSWPIEYGLGIMRFQLPRFLTPLRPVPAVVGHTGSTGTWLFHCPLLDLYLVGGLSQITAGPLPFRFVPKVLRAAQESGIRIHPGA
jgi:D-alanyl-D-alanine carboxypeptidase